MSSRAERIKELEGSLCDAMVNHYDLFVVADLAERLGELKTADKYEAILETRVKEKLAALDERVSDLQRRLTEAHRTVSHLRARIHDAAGSLEARARKMRKL